MHKQIPLGLIAVILWLLLACGGGGSSSGGQGVQSEPGAPVIRNFWAGATGLLMGDVQAQITDMENDLEQVVITWGDGTRLTYSLQERLYASHVYSQSGRYRVTLSATDRGGRSTTVSQTLRVR